MNELTTGKMTDWFASHFGHAPDGVVKAPGRVNLIGEHTDYNEGFVLPAAINYYTFIAYSRSESDELTLISHNQGKEEVVVNLTQPQVFDPHFPWTNYVRGVVQEMQRKGFAVSGGQLFIAGDVPAGAGLSSSASFEMAVVRSLSAMSAESVDPTAAALMGQAAENNFVGCNCGIMDQLISARGEASHALLIDCRDLTIYPVPIPQDWEIFIVHSGVKRGLVDSEYNVRRRQCEAAAAHFGLSSLRDLSLTKLLEAEADLDPMIFRRARHVLTENERTLIAAEALRRGDLAQLAVVMKESHLSMRDDFGITTPAIDRLVDIITEAGEGGIGARMTGGGFGGCVVAVAPAEQIPLLSAAVTAKYQLETGNEPRMIRAKASAGAFGHD